MTTIPSPSGYACSARWRWRRAFSSASALRSIRRHPRTMSSTCSAMPARPTASSRSSVSSVATRVSARTFEYDSSPRASASFNRGVSRAHAPRGRVRKRRRARDLHARRASGRTRRSRCPSRRARRTRGSGRAAARSRLEVRGELGDVIAEPFEIDIIRVSRKKARTTDVHRHISLRRL